MLKNLFIPSSFINCNYFDKRQFSISDRDINESNEINREKRGTAKCAGENAGMWEIVKRKGGLEVTRMAHFSRGDEN